MAFISAQLVDAIAHANNITKLSSEAAKALAQDVEYKLRELIQDAQKFVRHSRRSKLTTEDVNMALRMRNAEPLYGFSNKDPAMYLKAAGQADVYCLEDRDIPVEQLIEAPLPKPPVEVGIMPHWLFIKGVQPMTAENTPIERPPLKRQRTAAPAAGPAGEQAQPGEAAKQAGEDRKSVQVQLPVQHVLPLELQLYFTKALEVISSSLTEAKLTTAATPPNINANGNTQRAQPNTADTGRQPQQQQYWGEMRRATADTSAATTSQQSAAAGLPGSTEQKLAAVLGSLATDPGLHPLTPYFVKFIADEVTACLPHCNALLVLLRLTRMLMRNDSLALHSYVHQLLPALLTCVVAKGLGSAERPGSGTADHWTVRQTAAQLVAEVCARYGAQHLNVQPRVSKTLLKALLDPGKPLTTHYGAVVGLAALGPITIRSLLLPQLPAYLQRLQPLLHQDSTDTPARPSTAMEIDMASPSPQSNDARQNAVTANGHVNGNEPTAGIPQHQQQQQQQQQQQDAMRVHGALVDAAAGALYELITQDAASALPSDHVPVTRPSPALLSKVASVMRQTKPTAQDQQQNSVAVKQESGATATAATFDNDRELAAAILTVSWREDVPLPEVAWAAGELLGPAFTARLPQARPANVSL